MPEPKSGDPNDKPGRYRVEMFSDEKSLLAILEKAERDGYEFRGMNDRLVVLYKETK